VDGPYAVLAKDVKALTYRDADVEPGKLYYYAVCASNAVGTSSDTLPAGAAAGLPAPWSQRDVGAVNVNGGTLFDGRTFTLEGAGAQIGGKDDQFQFAYVPMTGDGTITGAVPAAGPLADCQNGDHDARGSDGRQRPRLAADRAVIHPGRRGARLESAPGFQGGRGPGDD